MMRVFYIAILFFLLPFSGNSQEFFADYFDIAWGASENSEVMGKINLKENKEYKSKSIPKDYLFQIIEDASNNFDIETEFDQKGRIFGVLRTKKGITLGQQDKDFPIKIALYQGTELLKEKNIVVYLRKKILYDQLRENFIPYTSKITKLYGRFTYTEEELKNTIETLLENDGKFPFSEMYGAHPSDYQAIKDRGALTTDQRNAAREKGIEGDWKNVLKHIGGLGYSYTHSKTYGIPSGNKENLKQLRKALYLSLYQYVSNIGIDGDEVLIEGKPSGPYTGDGIAMMDTYRLISHQVTTHQWELTDPLAASLAQIMPYILKDKGAGDPYAEKLFYELKDYFQLFFAEVLHRREMDNIDGRWKKIADQDYSNGAWSDANIGHRYRSLMLMPIVWADYNQPITYVEYWYDDFFDGTKYEGKKYAKFSPTGILNDLREISKLFSVPTQNYGQSGFNPDGTISHHCDKGSDVAMQDYGFHWLINPLMEATYWNGSSKPINPKSIQFIIDRYNFTYANIIYKNRLDFTAIGRSHLANTKKFIKTELCVDGEELQHLIPEDSNIRGQVKFKNFLKNIKKDRHTSDTSMVFWNADLAIHRRESDGVNYYFSVKNKSVRTVGAEDFSEVRKSWHFGSGVFQLKITGNEYEQIKLNKWDHHTVPGVTEEWRIDPLPLGHSAASGPGGNDFSGQLANGSVAMAGYHHKPKDSYTSANAKKSYYMIENIGTAVGTDIKRVRKGQEKSIVTTIDQNYFESPITYFDGKKVHTLQPEDSHNITFESSKNTWVHFANKGYLIFPFKGQRIVIKTNKEVNVTNRLDSTYIKHYTGHYYLPSPKFGTAVIAIDHGVNPSAKTVNQYHYTLVANVPVDSMNKTLKNYEEAYSVSVKEDTYHAVQFKDKLTQVTFFRSGRVPLNDNNWIESNRPALIMFKQNKSDVELSLSNPLHTIDVKKLIVKTNFKLKAGKYLYQLKGINPQKGEYFIVTNDGENSIITVQLPDSSDADRYNNQEAMYAGSPLIVKVPIRN